MTTLHVREIPTVVVGGIQRYAKVYALSVLDAAGAEVLQIPVQNDRPGLVSAVAYQVAESLRDGYTLDGWTPEEAEIGRMNAQELFKRGSALPGGRDD